MEAAKEILYWEIFAGVFLFQSVYNVPYVLSPGNDPGDRYYLQFTIKDPQIIQLYKSAQLECDTVTQV